MRITRVPAWPTDCGAVFAGEPRQNQRGGGGGGGGERYDAAADEGRDRRAAQGECALEGEGEWPRMASSSSHSPPLPGPFEHGGAMTFLVYGPALLSRRRRGRRSPRRPASSKPSWTRRPRRGRRVALPTAPRPLPFLAAARPSTQCVLACSMSGRAFAAVAVLQGELDAGKAARDTLVAEHAEAVAVAAAEHSAALGELEEQMTARLTEAEVRPPSSSWPPPDCTARFVLPDLHCLPPWPPLTGTAC